MKTIHTDCTVLVLSKDRHNFLERFIDFYARKDTFPIVIVDGSEEVSTSITKRESKEFRYFYFGPDKTILNFIEKTIYEIGRAHV